jgi:UDP-4-amino-4,6-dideoxy-N-acetyl-beta-L-altrosamine transaminase
MSDDFLPYGSQWLDEDDIQSVVDVLRGDWLTTGPAVDDFEAALSETCGAEHVVAVNSGTAALHAAYHAAGVGPGDEVIVPPLTFSATANAARYLGAGIRFVDIDPETLTLSPSALREAISDKTRAVAVVDYAGHPGHLDELRDIAHEYDAVLIEDACHAIGGAYKGAPIGSVADMTCFSFHPVKTITSGEGGALLTDNAEWAESARRFRTHGMVRGVDRLSADDDPGGWAYDIAELGYNYRITDIQCALGKSQLDKLDAFVERRQQIAAQYRELLADVEELELPPDADWCSHGYHLFVIRVPADSRKAIFETLRDRNIGVQVHYIPVNMLAAYRERGHDPEDTPIALETYRRAISIPCYPKMTDDDVQRSARIVRDVVAEHR